MSGFVKPDLQIAQPFGWLDQLERLLARELAPSPRKFRTALRISTIATIGAGLIASCHVNSQYGTYFVWLLAGAGPMLSARKACLFLIAEAFALAASVVMARALVEAPWLMMPFLFALFSLSTYFGTIWKLGAFLLLIEVVCLIVSTALYSRPRRLAGPRPEHSAAALSRSVCSFYLTIGCGPTPLKRT
jgi:hypothetical protein